MSVSPNGTPTSRRFIRFPMSIALLLVPAAAAALISYALAPWAGRAAVWLGALDQPGPRKIHRHPIPRLGGLAVLASAGTVAIGVRWLAAGSVQATSPRLLLGFALGLLPIV